MKKYIELVLGKTELKALIGKPVFILPTDNSLSRIKGRKEIDHLFAATVEMVGTKYFSILPVNGRTIEGISLETYKTIHHYGYIPFESINDLKAYLSIKDGLKDIKAHLGGYGSEVINELSESKIQEIKELLGMEGTNEK